MAQIKYMTCEDLVDLEAYEEKYIRGKILAAEIIYKGKEIIGVDFLPTASMTKFKKKFFNLDTFKIYYHEEQQEFIFRNLNLLRDIIADSSLTSSKKYMIDYYNDMFF